MSADKTPALPPLLADYEVEAMAAEFIAEDWTPDRYYRELNLIAFSNALQTKVRAALAAASPPAPTSQPAQVVPAGPAEAQRDRYFSSQEDMGIVWCATEAEARQLAEDNLKYLRKQAGFDGEWDATAVESVCWGVVLGRAVVSDEDGEHCDYRLAATPAAAPAAEGSTK